MLEVTHPLKSQMLETPYLVINLNQVEEKFRLLTQALPAASIYYAVKANPDPEILKRLVRMGSSFDAASIFEIEQCLAAGASPLQISFGNTIKKIKILAVLISLGCGYSALTVLENSKR